MSRLLNILRAAVTGETHLWLKAADRKKAACDLDDASLVKWTRWALVMANRFYEKDADRRERDLQELVVMHAVVSLALITLRSNSTKATFDVGGVTFRNEQKGDWRVIIEQIEDETP